jgi:hypothetical protein
MQEAQGGGYSGGSLLLAAAGSCLLGVGLGYHVARRELAVVAGKGAAPRNGRAVPKLHFGSGANGGGYGSLDSTPAATPRSLSRSDIAGGSGLRMVLLMRTDVALVRGPCQHCCCGKYAPPFVPSQSNRPSPFPCCCRLQSKQEVAEQASRTVLGMFKKQYKRRDPNLRGWEEGGHQMKVRGREGCP